MHKESDLTGSVLCQVHLLNKRLHQTEPTAHQIKLVQKDGQIPAAKPSMFKLADAKYTNHREEKLYKDPLTLTSELCCKLLLYDTVVSTLI